MLKRQDAGRLTAGLTLALFTLLMITLAACQPLPTRTEAPLLTPSSQAKTTSTVEPKHSQTSEPSTPPAQTRTPTTDCLQTSGRIENQTFYSDILKKQHNVIVYLPPCYQEAGANGFPVLYLLHGLSYSNDQWLQLGLHEHMDALIARGEIAPFIVVLPQETPSQPPQVSPFPEILTKELIPWIDSRYPSRAERSARGIGGVSRGAAWAVQIGFDHPGLFCCIGAHSLPLFQADGGKITGWLSQTPAEQLPRVFIDIGRNDQEWPSAQDFANQLDAAHVPHEWYLFRGDHTEDYWASHLELYLRWYAQDW